MIFVNRTAISHPEVFFSNELKISNSRLEDFYRRSKESRAQERYNIPFEVELKTKLLRALDGLFNSKCAYCESSVSNITPGEIDNFRPKSGARGLQKEFSQDHYWWLSYNWNNLYYCCPNCTRYKSTWFPVEGNRANLETPYEQILLVEKPLLIDPCVDDPEQHFTYQRSGEIESATTRGKTTIEIMKLNRADLVEARKNAVDGFEEEWNKLLALFSISNQNSAAETEFKKLHISLKGLLFENDSNVPYIGITRYILKQWEEDIAPRANIRLSPNTPSKDLDKELTQSSVPNSKFITDALEEVRHIYVEGIEVSNFKCFDKLTIDLSNNLGINISKTQKINPIIEPWVLFLGENGVGKSSILKAITIGLAGKEYISDLKILGKDILKHGKESGFIKIHLVGSVKPIEVHFTEDEITSTLFQPIVNFVAYNSMRLTPHIDKLEPESTKFYGAKAKNLFDYTYTLVDPDHWLMAQDKIVFDRVALALKDLMLLDANAKIEKTQDGVIIRINDEIYKIKELSDGYQSMFAMAIDIMATFINEGVTFDVAEGMVLIDEIGTHLHPRWRMEVVDRLRKTFPRISFVVTTHEPLCLRGLLVGETVLLTKNTEGDLVAITDLPDPSELRVDQLLTSDFFGLNSTIDPKTEKIFDEYYAILAMNENVRTDFQRTRLLELSEQIPKMKHLGDSLREEIIYFVVDELLAKKTRQEGLKMKDELKIEALARVESLWTLITKEKS